MARENPLDAVVSIWRQARGEFLGSGAFIWPSLVLTAKHVLQVRGDTQEIESPQAIRIQLVDGHGPITPRQFHCHPDLDMAVLVLKRDFTRQQQVRLNCQHSDLDNKKVDLYGVDPTSHGRSACLGYTLGAWDDQQQSYLFDHAQLKGFSGGIVVWGGEAVGIMTRRRTREQQGAMLPITQVLNWLQEVLPPEVIEPLQTPSADPAVLSQHAFTQRVRQEVGQLLLRPALRPLRDHLAAQATAADQRDNPETLLAPLDETFSIDDSLRILRQATRECRRQLAEQGADAVAAQELNARALGVFGWLVLLTVSERWAQDKLGPQTRSVEQHFQTLLGATYLALPVETEAGAQVVEARLREQPAALELDSQGFDPISPFRVRLGHFERGIDLDDQLRQVKELIWNTVFKGTDEPLREPFLKEILEIRYQDGKSYYVMLPAVSGGAAAGQERLLRLLRRDLPHLGTFLIGLETGEQVLVMNESRLWALTSEFLRVLQEQ